MKPHTSQFKTNIKTLGKEIDSKITYTIDNEETILGAEQLNSVTPHYESNILKSVMKQLDIESTVDIPIGTVINYQFGLKVGSSYEYLDFGNYIVYSSEKQEDTNSYKLVCYDKMLYAMKEYADVEYSFPMTVRSYLNAVCTTLGLTFANASDTFANYNRSISSDKYLDGEGNSLGYTFRDVLDQLAEVTASTICINEEDKLEIRYIQNTHGKNIYDKDSTPYRTGYYESGTGTLVSNNEFSVYKAKLCANCKYTITNSGGSTSPGISFFDKNGTFLSGLGYSNRMVVTFTTPENTNYALYSVVTNSSSYRYDKNYFQLEEGENSTTYESFTQDEIDEEYLKDVNVKFGEKYGPVNSIVLSRAGGSDNIYSQDETSIEQNGLCEIKIEDNQIMSGNDRSDYLSDILNTLDGLEYYINDFASTGITYYELCDRYNIKVGDNIYSCIMFNDEINITQGIEELINTEIPEKSETDYTKADKTDRRLNQTYIIVDKQNQVISSLVSTQEEMSGEISDLQDSIEVFSVDLSQYNVVVSTDNDRKPYATETLSVNYYGYYKGTQVTPTVSLSGSQNNVTTSTTNSAINFRVTSGNAIGNKSYTYTATFTYTADGVTYTVVKKIVMSLSVDGKNGTNGTNGRDGTDGVSAYFYVRYSANSDGNPMTTSPQSDTKYMGVASTTSPTAPSQPSGYVWSETRGEDGHQGIPGQPGEDGTSSYLHIKWSDDGETFTPAQGSTPAGKTPGRWQGTYVDTNETDSSTFSDYNWVDTGIYVQDELNALGTSIGAVDARITDTNTNIANNYYNKDQVDAKSDANANNISLIQQRVVTLEQKSDSYAININKILTDGVSSVTTATGYVFDENGLNISKTGSEIANLLDNTGMFVRRNSTEMLGADATGVRAENLLVRKYLIMGTNSRFEDYETNRTACFYIGGSN